MPFSTESEQIKKFENDEVAQHYFEVLRTLISKKSGRNFHCRRC